MTEQKGQIYLMKKGGGLIPVGVGVCTDHTIDFGKSEPKGKPLSFELPLEIRDGSEEIERLFKEAASQPFVVIPTIKRGRRLARARKALHRALRSRAKRKV